jgi:hypothetical protein
VSIQVKMVAAKVTTTVIFKKSLFDDTRKRQEE